jgi:hypothetical protein
MPTRSGNVLIGVAKQYELRCVCIENPMNECHYGKKTGFTVCAWVAWFLQYLTVPASCRVTTSMTRRYPYIESSEKAQNILTEPMAQNALDCMVLIFIG